ncbi:MAG: hypothetical protein QXV37_00815 [Candidatus Jordarchaeaceae archaeon]
MLQDDLVRGLANEVRNELRVLGAITARGLALFSVDGRLLFSDMAADIQERLKVFIPSFPALSIGSNITVTLDENSLLIMRVSERMVLAVFTDQKAGVVLMRMASLIRKYEEKFDKAVEEYAEKSVT